MLEPQVMMKDADEVPGLVSSKAGLKHAGKLHSCRHHESCSSSQSACNPQGPQASGVCLPLLLVVSEDLVTGSQSPSSLCSKCMMLLLTVLAGQDVDSMVAVAKAYKDRSLQGFQDALALHKEQLVEDPIVHAHLSELYDTLLEGNLARLIEPFSCVEISHLAQLIKLPQDLVLNKLSQVSCFCLYHQTPPSIPEVHALQIPSSE